MLSTSVPNASVPALPVISPPLPNPCGLFELGSTADNESYEFYNLLTSDLAAEWKKIV